MIKAAASGYITQVLSGDSRPSGGDLHQGLSEHEAVSYTLDVRLSIILHSGTKARVPECMRFSDMSRQCVAPSWRSGVPHLRVLMSQTLKDQTNTQSRNVGNLPCSERRNIHEDQRPQLHRYTSLKSRQYKDKWHNPFQTASRSNRQHIEITHEKKCIGG